jgi:hypothetical protein
MWMILMGDEIDSVRVKTIESTLKLAEKLAKKEVQEGLVPKLRECLARKAGSWRIRYAIAEVVGPLIEYMGKTIFIIIYFFPFSFFSLS